MNSQYFSSLRGLKKCCRENVSWNRAWKSPWKMLWNLWWNLPAPLSSVKEARKCPELFTTNVMPFFARCFAAANAQFHGISHSAARSSNQRRALYGPILLGDIIKGNSYGPMTLCLVFREICMDQRPLKFAKVSPETGIGLWMALPSKKFKWYSPEWFRRFWLNSLLWCHGFLLSWYWKSFFCVNPKRASWSGLSLTST